MWNVWLVLMYRHCELGYWLVQDIVPWWGTWSRELYYNDKGYKSSEERAPSAEVAIMPPAEAEPVEMSPAEAEPVECQTRFTCEPEPA